MTSAIAQIADRMTPLVRWDMPLEGPFFFAVLVLVAPWTLRLLPVLGMWYVLALSQFLIYEQMGEAFCIGERYAQTPDP